MRTFHGVPVVRAPASPVAPVAPAAAGKEGEVWDFTNEQWCLRGYIEYPLVN
jgi:hypothetical protein